MRGKGSLPWVRGAVVLLMVNFTTATAQAGSDAGSSCATHADCDPGEACLAGACSSCLKDFDCGPDENCHNGVCSGNRHGCLCASLDGSACWGLLAALSLWLGRRRVVTDR